MVEQGIVDRSPVTMRLRRRGQPRPPCILDLRTAQRLVDLAGRLADRSTAPLRGPAYSTIFSLLFGLGLRVGEVARLRWRDVDCDRNVLIIRETKFFMDKRSVRVPSASPDTPVFSFIGGRPVNPGTISIVFHSLVPQLNIAIPAGGTPPHVHDLRHSFAVGRLRRWYRDGGNPADHQMKLSTLMGHVDPISTAVYLTITTDLMEAAGLRFARFAAPRSTGDQP
jgi:integrase